MLSGLSLPHPDCHIACQWSQSLAKTPSLATEVRLAALSWVNQGKWATQRDARESKPVFRDNSDVVVQQTEECCLYRTEAPVQKQQRCRHHKAQGSRGGPAGLPAACIICCARLAAAATPAVGYSSQYSTAQWQGMGIVQHEAHCLQTLQRNRQGSTPQPGQSLILHSRAQHTSCPA